jgi:hypothetical protein
MKLQKQELSTTNVKVNVNNLLLELTPEIANTFTEQQIQAIEKSLRPREWSDAHPINLRVSVLFPPIKFYLVLLAGEERRSKQRLQYERSLYPFWNFPNICFLSIFFLVFFISSFYILFFSKSLINNHPNLAFPTSIPGVDNQEYCEQFNRRWENNKCWDNQHSPYF